MRLLTHLVLIFILTLPLSSNGQQQPVGQWREHLSYTRAIRLAIGDERIFCATPQSLFTLNPSDNSIEKYSRINGLSETGISTIDWDGKRKQLVIAFSNSNIDILTSAGIVNIDDFKIKDLPADKTIYAIYCQDDFAWLSTGLGIVVVDLLKYEVKDTYIIGSAGSFVRVNGVAQSGTAIFAASDEGLKTAPANGVNLSDYRNWQLITGSGLSAGPVRDVKLFSGKLVVLKNDSLFVQSGVSWTPFFSPGSPISSMSVSENKLLVTLSGQTNPSVIGLNAAGVPENNLQHALLRSPLQAKLWQNTVWVADSISGLVSAAGNSFRQFQPNSPQSSVPGALATRNKAIWYAAGRGVDRFRDEEWKSFSEKNTPPIANMPDLLSPAISADGSLYVGSNGGGMLQLKEDGSVVIFRQASPLEPSLSNQNLYRVTGLAFDTENNLWIANSGAANNLAVKKADDSWRKFFVPFTIPDNAVSQIVIDDINQKWIIAPGNGLICFNHGLTIDNPGDDRWKMFRTGKGSGNLPDNAVLSIAKDRNGFIWVGTARGIGIIQCPQEVFSPAGCEAILPVVQQDNFAGYLFRDEKVQAIAVDGADRKWIGTANGVWLISADGAKTLERFTAGNSVLLDNNISSIAIDEKTGEVFFSTAKGICSYRGAATTGGEKTEDLLVFPNPVPPGYTGTIAIRGLVKDATVKIVELNGRLVYQTRALGGQAVWNGKDYLGRTVSTGVYLVLISDDSRKEKAAARIVFISK